MVNWRHIYAKSFFILILLWGPLFIWAITGMLVIELLAFFLSILSISPLPRELYNYGFLVVHLLSVIVLSRYLKDVEIRVSPEKSQESSIN